MRIGIEAAFNSLAESEGRQGVISSVAVAGVRLHPEQSAYLARKLAPLGVPHEKLSAVSIGIAYRPEEIGPIPERWTSSRSTSDRWNRYAASYHDLNGCLSRIARSLAAEFGGVAEGPTREGVAGTTRHVTDYYPTCVSHRAFAEASGLGWRGKHGLIVTPKFGPAFRLATVFIPAQVELPCYRFLGCGGCTACLDVCPVLAKGRKHEDLDVYRENCRRRIKALALDADVCGICVRRCYEAVVGPLEPVL